MEPRVFCPIMHNSPALQNSLCYFSWLGVSCNYLAIKNAFLQLSTIKNNFCWIIWQSKMISDELSSIQKCFLLVGSRLFSNFAVSCKYKFLIQHKMFTDINSSLKINICVQISRIAEQNLDFSKITYVQIGGICLYSFSEWKLSPSSLIRYGEALKFTEKMHFSRLILEM